MLHAAALCFTLAAPVPMRPAEFGAGGAVTASELEALPYVTLRAGEEKNYSGGVGVALHLPRRRFRAGEPIPAYFVVRNFAPRPAGLDMRLDLFGPARTFNSCSARVVRTSDRKDMGFVPGHVYSCGSGSLLTLPANGFYCARGLLDAGLDGPLPAGEYECSWTYDRLRSRSVTFTVVPGKPAAKAAALSHSFYALRPGHEPTRLPAADFAAALATGATGLYHPDVRDLPERDGPLTAMAEWGKGERLRVTLRAAGGKAVRVSERPNLYLQVESPTEDDFRRAEEGPAEAKREVLRAEEARTPLTLDVPLPAGWRKRLVIPAGARVAVIVASERIEDHFVRGGRLEVLREKRDRSDRGARTGLMRTPWLEVGRE